MTTPSKAPKATQIEDLLEAISQVLGTPRSVAFRDLRCVMCGGQASTFKSELCAREYSLSGMCQVCQDGFFDGPEESEGE
jgi:hypothetical protein